MTTLETPLTVATTITANATVAAGSLTPADATSGNITATLPTPTHVGARLAVQKVDASANTVTLSGSIRGSVSTITMVEQYHCLILRWNGSTWWPEAAHWTRTSISALGAAAFDTKFNAKGDIRVGTGSGASTPLGVGSNGQVPTADSTQTSGIRWATPSAGASVPDWTLPTGVLRQNLPRTTAMASAGASSSGLLRLYAIYLTAGDVINSIAFTSSSTALAGGSNQWFSLWDASRNKLAVTSDDTSTAWAAATRKSLNLTSPYTVPTSGLYYAGVVIVATTMPTLLGYTGTVATHSQAPIMSGTADSGLTNPASAPAAAAALTALSTLTWVQVA